MPHGGCLAFESGPFSLPRSKWSSIFDQGIGRNDRTSAVTPKRISLKCTAYCTVRSWYHGAGRSYDQAGKKPIRGPIRRGDKRTATRPSAYGVYRSICSGTKCGLSDFSLMLSSVEQDTNRHLPDADRTGVNDARARNDWNRCPLVRPLASRQSRDRESHRLYRSKLFGSDQSA